MYILPTFPTAINLHFYYDTLEYHKRKICTYFTLTFKTNFIVDDICIRRNKIFTAKSLNCTNASNSRQTVTFFLIGSAPTELPFSTIYSKCKVYSVRPTNLAFTLNYFNSCSTYLHLFSTWSNNEQYILSICIGTTIKFF